MNIKTGIKYDNEKPRWDLLPLDAVEPIVQVLTFGARKYKTNDWKNVRPTSRYVSAAMRHLKAYQAGEMIDQESGLPHLAHAMTNLVFLTWMNQNPMEEANEP